MQDPRPTLPVRMRRAAARLASGRLGPVTLAAALLLLLPLVAFARFPSQDGPSHLANAWLLLSLLRDGGGELAPLYRVNLDAFPNWFTHASLAGLLSVMGPVAAEKTFLVAYVLLLVGAFRYALASLRTEAASLAVLVFPFVYDSSLHLGYYNRSFALVPLLLALGFWARRRGRLGVRGSAALAALLLWLYFCAAVSLVVALVGLALLLVGVTLEERASDAAGRSQALARRGLALAAAGLAPALLLARFQSQQTAGVAGPGPGVLARLRALLTLDSLVSLDARELWLSGALAVVLAVACLAALAARVRAGGWHRHDALLGAAALCTAGYLLAPAVRLPGHGPWGGSSHDRIAPHIPLLLLLWLAAQPLRNGIRRLLLVSTIAIGLGLPLLRLPRYAELNQQLDEYLSVAPWLPRGAALLPLGFAHQGRGDDGRALADRTWPFRHAAGWLVVSRDVVDVDNYEAQVPFFPVTLRPGYDPYRLLGSSLDRLPACVRIDRFNRLAPRPAEYLLLWGARSAERGDPCAAALFELIETRYRRVYTSTPRGLAELYRRSMP